MEIGLSADQESAFGKTVEVKAKGFIKGQKNQVKQELMDHEQDIEKAKSVLVDRTHLLNDEQIDFLDANPHREAADYFNINVDKIGLKAKSEAVFES